MLKSLILCLAGTILLGCVNSNAETSKLNHDEAVVLEKETDPKPEKHIAEKEEVTKEESKIVNEKDIEIKEEIVSIETSAEKGVEKESVQQRIVNNSAKEESKVKLTPNNKKLEQEIIETKVELPKHEPRETETIELKEKDNNDPRTQEISDSQIERTSKTEKPMQIAWNHQIWDDLLRRYVSSDGQVDYAGIKANPKGLEAYVNDLKSNAPLPGWSANKEKAYWINVYNAYTIKMIIDNYPVQKITDLHGGKPWDQKWINIGNKTYSLNDVEHKILRPKFNDARIHFAVNCAAKSCPKVWNRAWTEENIEGALETLTKAFVTNTSQNQITPNAVNLSKIFEWYREDFGDLINFLNKYSTTKISSNAKIAFNDYDWKLNS